MPGRSRRIRATVGLNLTTDSKDFAGIQGEPAVGNIAGRVSVKQIVRIHPVEGEQVAGIALAIRHDALVAESLIRA